MNNLYILSLKRIMLNKFTRIILLGILLICLFLSFILADNAKSKSSIPIGVLNLDESKDGAGLLEKIKQIPAFYVYEGKGEELKKLLKNDRVQAVFIINEGYEKAIKSGRTNGLITLLYKENNSAVKILSDIFAGEMLNNICLYKGYLMYETSIQKDVDKAKEAILSFESLEEYASYVNSLNDSKDNSFSFHINITNSDLKTHSADRLDNSFLYMQILGGILTMFLSFAAFYMALPQVIDSETGIRKRLKIASGGGKSLFTHDLYAIWAGLTLLFCFNLILSLVFYITIPGLTTIRLVLLFLLFFIYSGTILIGYILIGMLTRTVSKYQGTGIFIAIVFGMLGVVSTFAGLFGNNLLNISKLVPNSWFIKGFIDIILNTGLQDIPYMQFFSLGTIGLFFVVILWVCDNVNPN